MTDPDLAAMLPSWVMHLRAERKSPATIKLYSDGVLAFLTWAEANKRVAVLDRVTVNEWIADVLDSGLAATTARSRQLAVRLFAAWLLDEGEIDADPLVGLKPPKLDTKVIEPLTEADIKALLKACQGTDFMARRDEALLRFMLETGARAGEVIALQVADVDLGSGTAIVRRGKGGKGRVVPFGPQTTRALDRYMRQRRTHRLASGPSLWLGDRGKDFTYSALHLALGKRAKAAGVKGFHPHLARHTAASRWLAAGGSEGGLMAVAGWSRPDMLMRYTRATAEARAADEARSLNLGDM